MRIAVLQHTPNEGPGAIAAWSAAHHHEITIYHPYQFNILPQADELDLLVLLGGPMSPNDDLPWIHQERALIQTLLDEDKPMFGACFGAQQIAKTLGYPVDTAEAKEVGWAKIYRKSTVIPNLPETLLALHWHQERFAIPEEAQWLFASDLVANQGFVMRHKIVGLQCHLEPLADNVRTMVANDGQYTAGSALHQTPADILAQPVPAANQQAINAILDYITQSEAKRA
ncbi:type 1 glutamine amidotransferase [Lacticaseibacillus jixiensis]|uniref:type 1 glutamine amidotransferase n=1 Tax=Lacticaseibacillus jixiensis TaxID=3231926 RepID=UPI0036F2DC83